MAATVTTYASVEPDIEMQSIGPTAISLLKNAYDTFKRLSSSVIINPNQMHNLSRRLSTVFSTLLRMPSPCPTPDLVTVVRSVFEVLRIHCDMERSLKFLCVHFTARDVFRAVRIRLAKSWSLLQTSSWDQEDAEAATLDETHNLDVLLECQGKYNNFQLPRFYGELLDDRGRLLSVLRRRSSSSAWKAQVSLFEWHPDDFANLPQSLKLRLDLPQQPPVRCGFRCFRPSSRDQHLRYSGTDVVVAEVSPDIRDDDEIETFVLEAVHRFSWCHPCVCPFLGAITEGVDCAGKAFLTMSNIEEDLVGLGFTNLDDILFSERRRPSLSWVIAVALKIADAVHYIRDDAQDLIDRYPLAWSMVPPSAIFVREVPHHAHSLEDPWLGSLPPETRLAPPLVRTKVQSRWQPPGNAACPEAYGVCMLLIAALTNTPPYCNVDDPDVIRASIAASVPPFGIPTNIPIPLQHFCEMSLSRDCNSGFPSFRAARVALMTLYDLCHDWPEPATHEEPTFASLQAPVQDYGIICS